jgi:hypothetical protein
MALPAELGRVERWLCNQAYEAERAGPLAARTLPLFQLFMVCVVLGTTLWRGVFEGIVEFGVPMAVAGFFGALALEDLVWPRRQRMIALLYGACLEETGRGQDDRKR